MAENKQKAAIRRLRSHPIVDTCLRIFLYYVTIHVEFTPSFERYIAPEELWMYKYPKDKDYVPLWALLLLIVPLPFLLFAIDYYVNGRQRKVLRAANLSYSLAFGLNGAITGILKVVVGRPRPDFFWRCFPDGVMNDEMQCQGKGFSVLQARKSFPSGHASYSWVAMSFIAFYLFAKWNCFNERGRGDALYIIGGFTSFLVAALVAVSRTCDYHHHYTDVLAGSLLGFGIAYFCYRQYFPPLNSPNCHVPYSSKRMVREEQKGERLNSTRSRSLSNSKRQSLFEEEVKSEVEEEKVTVKHVNEA